MDIHVENQQNALQIDKDQVSSLVAAVLLYAGERCDEVAIHFVTIEHISALHKQFFDDPSPTDCISFPIDDKDPVGGYRVLGDVFVCPAIAIEYAHSCNADSYEEASLYVVHGLLHLMGYDDIEDAARVEMRAAEERHMKNLQQQKKILYNPGNSADPRSR
jgi:probable rRNA maturation factor